MLRGTYKNLNLIIFYMYVSTGKMKHTPNIEYSS